MRAGALVSGQALTTVLHAARRAEAAVHTAGVCAHLVGVVAGQGARAPTLLEDLASVTHHGCQTDE